MKFATYIAFILQLWSCNAIEARPAGKAKQPPAQQTIISELMKQNKNLKRCFQSQGIKHKSLILTIAFFQLSGRVRVPYMKVNHKGYRSIAFCIEKTVKAVKFRRKDEGKLHRYIFEYQKVSQKIVVRRQNPK